MNKIVIEGESLQDVQRLMVALFGEERSYATYKEMAEAAEKLRETLTIIEKRSFNAINTKNAIFERERVLALKSILELATSSLKNEEVLDKDKEGNA